MALGQDSIGFILADVTRLMRQWFSALQADSGLTLAEARALIYIARNEGIRQVDLAEILEIQAITLTRLLDQLEGAGLVRRDKMPGDRRAFQLCLTDKAAPMLAAIEKTAGQVRGMMLRGFSADEAAAVVTALRRMRENLAADRRANEQTTG